MDSTKFDTLTKALATPKTRRQALRRIGGALTGALVGGGALTGGLRTFLSPEHTFAAGGNSDCTHFCASVFGADTPAAGQCTSDAAHHKGLCYTCGPAGPSGTQPICCSENSSGFCSSYSSATCCPLGQGCCTGTCTDLNTNSNCGSCGNKCDACSTCQNGTCASTGVACGSICCGSGTTCIAGICCPFIQICNFGSVCCSSGTTCSRNQCL